MAFPTQRMRRLRVNPTMRNMVRETSLSVNNLVYPLFITYGKDKKIPVNSMPGVYQYSVDKVKEEIHELGALEIPAVLLFGIPEYKDNMGTSGCQENGVVQEAIKTIKDINPNILVITDVCLCEYTDHGHCGIVEQDGTINNDKTLELLAQQAASHAKAGSDIIAPSDMMDGRVGYIRNILDKDGYSDISIMSYAAKYSSAFYGPFREAAESAPQFGDRKTYQMDSANIKEALREVKLDIAEGADIVMVKPALSYLDVIKAVKDKFEYPTAAYNVSGEYSMIKAAAEKGWLDGESVMYEVLTSIKRAGADIIISYAAKDVAKVL
ncbi:Porphobilinogen synthase [Candidatus Syntrophocurvum alkaliphilum]|uniref:Delta-aminolevulinic acid dehydratase n=1 Tax=Candidatus Syntrophocurvum alkaliphilum TaxID=2293317 RepID=A0A6I6DCA9_9FIRM|nr:porphobilinogen synthase [Candidatus Syntrophocurvum alkaliphilum]QGT99054.1 Porphobilinogen synthase [Candidatus Syntrophocurvum alkaliphilum]